MKLLSDDIIATSARFSREFGDQVEFSAAVRFCRDLRELARRAYGLECAKVSYEQMFEVAMDLDAHAIVAPPPELERALRSGRSRDLASSGFKNPVARAAADIPGTNVTIFPVVPRQRPITVEFGRDPGDETDGGPAA